MFPAMGTTVTVLFDGDVPTGALGEVRELFERWEATLSRFRPDSELSRLDREAGREMPASPLLRRVTSAALRAAAATGGVFDPTLGRRLAAIGYAAPFGSPQAGARGSASS